MGINEGTTLDSSSAIFCEMEKDDHDFLHAALSCFFQRLFHSSEMPSDIGEPSATRHGNVIGPMLVLMLRT